MGTRYFPLFASHDPKKAFLKWAMVIFGGGHDHSLVSVLQEDQSSQNGGIASPSELQIIETSLPGEHLELNKE